MHVLCLAAVSTPGSLWDTSSECRQAIARALSRAPCLLSKARETQSRDFTRAELAQTKVKGCVVCDNKKFCVEPSQAYIHDMKCLFTSIVGRKNCSVDVRDFKFILVVQKCKPSIYLELESVDCYAQTMI